MRRPIVERERELAELAAAATEAKAGSGSIVLIEGEAGIGKSSVVDAIRSVLPAEGRLLVGYCDDLATPRVLGPLRDLRDRVGTGLTAALDAGDRGAVLDALRVELDWAEHPTVLVVEDVHWADEATLDVLRFLVRRIAALPAVLVLTYRDDELTRDHPLRPLLGLVVREPRLRRLRLQPLSSEAVRRLGAGTTLDPGLVYHMTAGNPFLVAEVLASGDTHGVPASVTEAVQARLADLDGPTRDAVEQLAVIPSTVERWLVDRVVPGGLGTLASAEQHGVLTITASRVSFRHELTRRAVADSLSGSRRVSLNQSVLTALLDLRAQPGRGIDLSRILHHAAEVGDEATIVAHGPAAAAEAAAASSHREAVAHGRLVLRHRAGLAPSDLVAVLERHSVECYTLGLAEEAVSSQEDAVALLRELGDVRRLGAGIRWLSRVYWWGGDRRQAEASAADAIELLSGTDDEAGLTFALSNRAQLLALAGRHDEAIEVGERSVELARGLADPGLLAHALTNVGIARSGAGDPDAMELLDEGLNVALAGNEIEHASRAYVSIAWRLTDELELDRADQVLDQGIALAEDTEFLGFLRYLRVIRARVRLARCAWDEVEREAEWSFAAQPITASPALAVAGRARARRGDRSGAGLTGEAWALAVPLEEAQRVGPAGSALIEAAWLGGDATAAAEQVLPWYEEVFRHGAPPVAAELGFWLRRAGCEVPLVASEHPYALLARGRWREAATLWERAGCPYERALALAESPDAAELLEAVTVLDSIGAEPLARLVRQRLRDRGVNRIPRGPAPSTRDNRAGLTGRQAEVLALLADGLTNSEIAARLVLSVRTVDTHVAAILTKLGARSRREAADRARELGLTGSRPD